MADPIYWWLLIATYCGGDAAGLRLFIQGSTLRFLLGGFIVVNLHIYIMIISRCLRRTVTGWDYPR